MNDPWIELIFRTYPNVTLEEKDKFLRIKTDEYLRRRETIQSFCRNSSEPEFSRQIINSSLGNEYIYKLLIYE